MKVIQHGAKKSKVCNKYDRVRFGDTVIEEKKEKMRKRRKEEEILTEKRTQ